MKQFALKSTVLTIIVFIAGAFLYYTVLKPYYLPVFPLSLLFFYIMTNLVHSLLLKMVSKAGSRFTSQYMAVSFIKMFFYLAVAIVYVLFNRDQAKPFIANFLVLYIVYTVFEVYEFSKVVKQAK